MQMTEKQKRKRRGGSVPPFFDIFLLSAGILTKYCRFCHILFMKIKKLREI